MAPRQQRFLWAGLLAMLAVVCTVVIVVIVALRQVTQVPVLPRGISIPAIQGAGHASPLSGRRVVTQGVVTRLLSNGFFLQDPEGDGDDRTSDGLRVILASVPGPGITVGRRVQLSGLVTESDQGGSTPRRPGRHSVTQLTDVSDIRVLGEGPPVSPVEFPLPAPSDDDFARRESMVVTVPMPLTVSQNHFLGRYGQLTLSVEGRLFAPTNRFRPGADALAMAAADDRRMLLLDDGSSIQNPMPTPYLGRDGTLRNGDTVDHLTGVLDHGPSTPQVGAKPVHKIQPTRPPVFNRANARDAVPPVVVGDLKVASLNLLNYFTSLNDGRHRCGPAQLASDCRGARSSAELERQQAKLVETVLALDADVLGLTEVENNGAVALERFVEALNRRITTAGARYAAVPDPATGLGRDAIRVAMLYRPRTLTPVHAAHADSDAVHNRAPLAQTFATAAGEAFTVVVSHFKSKGCTGAIGADSDQGDLQACFNDRRRRQAAALHAFVQTLLSEAGSPHVLLIGDFNAYAQEDPIRDLADKGFIEQLARFAPAGAGYTHVFDARAGRLDHVLASASLSPRVGSAVEWHINADEPSLLDARRSPPSRDPGPVAPFRSSDHDPVLVGLRLGGARARRRQRLVVPASKPLPTSGQGVSLARHRFGVDPPVDCIRDVHGACSLVLVVQ